MATKNPTGDKPTGQLEGYAVECEECGIVEEKIADYVAATLVKECHLVENAREYEVRILSFEEGS